jgi:hypothetical protein
MLEYYEVEENDNKSSLTSESSRKKDGGRWRLDYQTLFTRAKR